MKKRASSGQNLFLEKSNNNFNGPFNNYDINSSDLSSKIKKITSSGKLNN